ncbi:MAG: GYD domain-containing protein [Phreatobacter sp.]
MPSYCILLNFTDQGIRTIRDGAKRIDAARDLAGSLGIEFTDLRLCLGTYDVMIQLEAPSDEALAKFVLATGTRGNVRSTTLKTFSEKEYRKLLSELPA